MYAKENIRDAALAFQKSRILLTAYELGVFTALGKNNKSSAEVAKIIKADARSTDRLMNALCAIGIIKKKKGLFSNTAAASRFLIKENPDFMAGLMHTVHLWDSWSTLTQAVRKGKSVLTQGINERGNNWLNAFIAAMHERASQQAASIIKLLDLKGVSSVLDVGAGSGAYSMAFVRAKKRITATVFDLPNVLPLTSKYIRSEGLSGKIKIVAGDYRVNQLGKGFDLIFLSAIIHSNSPEENMDLMKKCSKALNPSGQLVIQDFIMDKDRTSPAFGALFALNMLVGTQSGDTYTEEEVSIWMKKAGLNMTKRKDSRFGTALIIGRKRL